MPLSALLPSPLTRQRRDRRRATVPSAEPRASRAKVARARERRSGGPEDHALYRCGCGFVFTADVTAAVPCPHCGTAQAW